MSDILYHDGQVYFTPEALGLRLDVLETRELNGDTEMVAVLHTTHIDDETRKRIERSISEAANSKQPLTTAMDTLLVYRGLAVTVPTSHADDVTKALKRAYNLGREHKAAEIRDCLSEGE